MITGASSGIGAVHADRLAKRGYDLILVARDLARLQANAEQLSSSTGRRVDVIGADLSTLEGQRRVGQVLETDTRITMRVNNAGIGATQVLVESDVDRTARCGRLGALRGGAQGHGADALPLEGGGPLPRLDPCLRTRPDLSME